MEGTPSDVDIDEVITTIKKDSRIHKVCMIAMFGQFQSRQTKMI